ncbi:MAG: TonB-dependent receptor [Acidobacteria bacterium]|nr:TonB-dependent receptor [Acidobacteriota bacterium]
MSQPTHPVLRALAVVGLGLLLARPVAGSMLSSGGVIRGRVVAAGDRPVAGMKITLANAVTGRVMEETSGADGRFTFFNVPPNPYHLHATAAGYGVIEADISVHAGDPLDLALTATPSVSATVDVSDENIPILLEKGSVVKHVDVDKTLIGRAPAAVSSRGLEALVLQTPGFMADENGRFHFQGSHGQITYVVDGNQISDQIHAAFSNSLDPQYVESLEVISGNVPAEYGNKTAAVVNMTTKSGLGSGKAFAGGAFLGAARFGTYEGGLSASGGTDRFGWFLAGAVSQSERFLDPLVFENLHNEGRTGRVFGRFDLANEGFGTIARATFSAGSAERDVPNLPSQEAAGQDQTTTSRDVLFSLGVTTVPSASLVIEAQASGRLANQTFRPSAGDTPITLEQDRDLDNFQALASFSGTAGVHTWKVGVQGFFWSLREKTSFGITDAAYNEPGSAEYNANLLPYDLSRGGARFRYDGKGSPQDLAFYAQDTIRLGSFTATLGLRGDAYTLDREEGSLQPRIGAAYSIEPTGTVVRASYNRLFMTPENENLLLASSREAQALVPPNVLDELGTGALAIRAERQDAFEVGLEQRVGRLFKLSLSYWKRNAKNFSDNFQLLDTGVLFPVTLAEGRLEGADLRVDLARTAGFSGYVSLGTAKAVAVPPFTGGLFVSQEPVEVLDGGAFRIDHDQKLSAQVGVQYEVPKTGLWLGLLLRHDSGLVTEIEDVGEVAADPDIAFGLDYVDFGSDPSRVKARTVVNFSAGLDFKALGMPLSLQADLLNAFDEKGLYNFLSAFGGTHVIPPRTLAARVKVAF